MKCFNPGPSLLAYPSTLDTKMDVKRMKQEGKVYVDPLQTEDQSEVSQPAYHLLSAINTK